MIIAANWKMNLSAAQAKALGADYHAFASAHHEKLTQSGVELVIFPPALFGAFVHDACQGAPLSWGGQSCHQEAQGAFTGDLSAQMFASAGASWQLVGHSERRVGHYESDEDIAKQIASAAASNLRIMLCVGENLAQRQAGQAEEVVRAQIANALVRCKDISQITIAYEPVWAIGTGQVASAGDVGAMHEAIATFCTQTLGAKSRPQILYGGSVKASNAAELFALDYVDGALVGGASLTITDFAGIVEVCLK